MRYAARRRLAVSRRFSIRSRGWPATSAPTRRLAARDWAHACKTRVLGPLPPVNRAQLPQVQPPSPPVSRHRLERVQAAAPGRPVAPTSDPIARDYGHDSFDRLQHHRHGLGTSAPQPSPPPLAPPVPLSASPLILITTITTTVREAAPTALHNRL